MWYGFVHVVSFETVRTTWRIRVPSVAVKYTMPFAGLAVMPSRVGNRAAVRASPSTRSVFPVSRRQDDPDGSHADIHGDIGDMIDASVVANQH